ncbi:MAG: tetratricopeptide repeat protein, partial [Candidatus Hermodarchaeota archaeon]
MKLTSLTFKELIEGERLTFLIGAGCSVDAPSCLPAGRAMIETIIKYTCEKSEIEKILNISELRFEQLVEIVRDRLDPELKIIDYYGQCDKPNLQHFFLAEMLKRGHFVMTTNFDYLIEYAIIELGVPQDEIISVITKNEFEIYKNPTKLFNERKKAIYKIHGSPKNIITGEDTRDSLVATIQAFGSGKEGESVFQVEPFKRPLFENISNNRTIVVMGYSGSDDFDVVPTLRVLKNIKNIIWINYISDDGGREKIYEINEDDLKEKGESDKIAQILTDLFRMHNAEHIYRIETNTSRLCDGLLENKPSISKENFSISPSSWLKNNIETADEFRNYEIPDEIYNSFNMYEDSLRCSKILLTLAEEKNELSWKSHVLNNIGLIYNEQGDYPEALKNYEEALTIAEQLEDLSSKATYLNNIGRIYDVQGNYPEAMKRYEEALKIAEQIEKLSGKATYLNSIGLIYDAQGNYPEAMKRYEEALKIAEQLGDLSSKSSYLNNIGLVYGAQGNYPEAIKRLEEALKIAEQLGNLTSEATYLNNIGHVFKARGNYPEALIRCEKALTIADQLGEPSSKATYLNNIGLIYYEQGDYPEAMKRYEEALKIAEKLGNLSSEATFLNNIGNVHKAKGNYPEALNRCEKALVIAEKLGDLSSKTTYLNNIGLIYYNQGDYSEAMRRYEEALKIAEQMGFLTQKATFLNNIGVIYKEQGNYSEALKRYEEALRIAEQLEDPSGRATYLNSIGLIYDVQGNY